MARIKQPRRVLRKIEAQTFMLPINSYMLNGDDIPTQWAEIQHIGGVVVSYKLTPFQLTKLYETAFITAAEAAAQTNYNDTKNLD